MTLLCTWKEIAAYLRVDPRTAQRWAQSRGLPVVRVTGPNRATTARIYTYAETLDKWIENLADPDGRKPILWREKAPDG